MLEKIKSALQDKDKYTILYFTADWCGPCRMFKYVINSFLNKYSNSVNFIKINVDSNREVAIDYDISSVPTLLFIKNNILIKRKSGLLSESELEDLISN